MLKSRKFEMPKEKMVLIMFSFFNLQVVDVSMNRTVSDVYVLRDIVDLHAK